MDNTGIGRGKYEGVGVIDYTLPSCTIGKITEKDKYLANFQKLTEQMYKITMAKNSDYTGDNSQPFKNFTMVETMGAATTEQGFFTRMMDKLMRFSGFIKNGTLEVKDEQITDTLLDLANYCLLCICYLRSKNE